MSAPRSPALRRLYETLLDLAKDRTSELYLDRDGQLYARYGANARVAFWDGFAGNASHYGRASGTLIGAAYQAGKAHARRKDRLDVILPPKAFARLP